MKSRFTCPVLLAVFAIFPLALNRGACGGEYEVKFNVRESLGVARKAEPVSGGIPLPLGRFKKNQAFAIFKEGGGNVNCQVVPLVVQPDGTVRWVLLDFQDDIAAKAVNRYVLRAVAKAPVPATALRVTDTDDTVTVDTGRIKFTVSKKDPFGFLSSVETGGKKVVSGGEVYYEQMQGRRKWDDDGKWTPKKLSAGVPTSVKVWYAGPMRVTIEVKGKYDKDGLKAGYKTWITAWAGKSGMYVKHKLINSNPERMARIPVNRYAIKMNLVEASGKVMLGAGKGMTLDGSEASAWLHGGLYSSAAGYARAGSGDKTTWTAKAKEGFGAWIAVPGASTVFACDRLFRSNPARRLVGSKSALILEGLAPRFEGVKGVKYGGKPWYANFKWLFDCSHLSSEYILDFAANGGLKEYAMIDRASRNRLWALAAPSHYSETEATALGKFGSLADEKAAYKAWGWDVKGARMSYSGGRARPGTFKRYEDNHDESEADSVQGLLMMYLRTSQRGWFDIGESWARYHADLQAWRTDGWRWKDGAIWFPNGGPQGNLRVRKWPNFHIKLPKGWKKSKDPKVIETKLALDDLGRQSRSKSCYCHYYGSGLAEYYCLTGDRDALEAAIDNVDQKDDEARHYKKYKPGKSDVGSVRGFGRGFEVMMRVLMADPGNKYIKALADLNAQVCWRSPKLDERGVHLGGAPTSSPQLRGGWKTEFKKLGLTYKRKKTWKGWLLTGVTDTKSGKKWRPKDMGGTWQHIYVQNGADLYARIFDDDNMRDFTIGFGQMSAKFMRSKKCHQTWYYAAFDVAELGKMHDPWLLQHKKTTDGKGCVHGGWYTSFFPDTCAKAFSFTGERHLQEEAKKFWYYGSKRLYGSKGLSGGKNQVYQYICHKPPKNDSVMEACRTVYEGSHPRKDAQAPKAIADLKVSVTGGDATVSFTAPADEGGGKVTKYQVKCSKLPILPYEEWDYARDLKKKRNWWKAVNLKGEPAPKAPGSKESFTVSGVPAGTRFFAVRSFDDSWNRSAISNLGEVGK